MVPSASLLEVPLRVTVMPEVTVWLAPALATGGVFAVVPPLLLPPPPPPQATSKRAAMPASVRPGVEWRIPSYTGARRTAGVEWRLHKASDTCDSREVCR